MRFLDVDLTTGSVAPRIISEEDQARYLGGSGLAAKILAQETGSRTDPLGPDNRLIFALGPFTGTRVPCSGRHHIVAKSPLTGIFGESDVGGRFGTELAKTGVQGLVLRGQAQSPVLLYISQEVAELRDASSLWGLDTFATEAALKEDLGGSMQAACIGPAGERMVPLAAIMHDGVHARAAGRCGLGAVMGSKNLKAVVASGEGRPEAFDPAGMKAKARDMVQAIRKASGALSTCGTAGGIGSLEENGDLPIKNFLQSRWPEVENLSGEVIAELYLTRRFACGACPIGCGRDIEISGGRYGNMAGAGPEYESVGTLGSYCLVSDLEAVCLANDLCNRYGLDTISTGAAVAFGMEAYEQGLIDSGDLEGRSLCFGDPEAMLSMVRSIGEQSGMGSILGLGVRKAAERLGGRAAEFALHVKGLELPAHDPRAFFSSALSYATSNRGACHLAGFTHGLESSMTMPELGYPEIQDRFGLEGKGKMVALMQNLMGAVDSLKVCKFILGAISIQDLLDCYRLVTGRHLNQEELLRAGERIFTLKRLYNVALGMSRKDDTLPPRILTWPRRSGEAAGQLPHLGRMLADYYAYRSWDETGIPTREAVERLDLGWMRRHSLP